MTGSNVGRWLRWMALMLVVVVGAGCQPASPPLAGVELWQPGRELPPFQLQDHLRQPFDHSRLLGHWTLLFVGYTYCPDICPTTLAQMAGRWPQWQQRWPMLQLVLLSADPGRDTAERLSQYIPYFHQDFIGVTGAMSEVRKVSDRLELVFSQPDTSMPGYLVDHSASMVLLDPQGLAVAVFRPDTNNGSGVSVVDPSLIEQALPQLIADGG